MLADQLLPYLLPRRRTPINTNVHLREQGHTLLLLFLGVSLAAV